MVHLQHGDFQEIPNLKFIIFITKKIQVPKMEESENLYKLYGYGLYKGKPTPKIAWNKVQDSSILGSWNFWWFQFPC